MISARQCIRSSIIQALPVYNFIAEAKQLVHSGVLGYGGLCGYEFRLEKVMTPLLYSQEYSQILFFISRQTKIARPQSFTDESQRVTVLK